MAIIGLLGSRSFLNHRSLPTGAGVGVAVGTGVCFAAFFFFSAAASFAASFLVFSLFKDIALTTKTPNIIQSAIIEFIIIHLNRNCFFRFRALISAL